MSSSTLQFLVAGALIAAWAWMLGRPILTNLFRRSRRDSVGHFRYQQAVLGRPLDEDPFNRRPVIKTMLQPLRDWRSQPLERRRLQIMLGFSFATFFSLLTAIAFRGSAIRLFLIMVVCFAAYLGYAAYVGAAQIRRQQQAGLHRRQERSAPVAAATQRTESYVDDAEDFDLEVDEYRTGVAARYDTDGEFEDGVRLTGQLSPEDTFEEEDLALVAEAEDPFDGSEGFGTGDFEDEFFEPIPELQFAPLNLDASIIEPPASDDDLHDETAVVEPDHEQEVENDVVEVAIDEAAPLPATAEVETDEATTDATPAFTAPPRQRQRPARKKARPIYIESVLDEADDEQRVVND